MSPELETQMKPELDLRRISDFFKDQLQSKTESQVNIWAVQASSLTTPWDAVQCAPLSLHLKVFSNTLTFVENSLICGSSILGFPWWLSQIFSESNGRCHRDNISGKSKTSHSEFSSQPT